MNLIKIYFSSAINVSINNFTPVKKTQKNFLFWFTDQIPDSLIYPENCLDSSGKSLD